MMEKMEAKGWQQLLSRNLKVVFQDGMTSQGNPHYSHKTGVLTCLTEDHLFLNVSGRLEGVQISHILRFEEVMIHGKN